VNTVSYPLNTGAELSWARGGRRVLILAGRWSHWHALISQLGLINHSAADPSTLGGQEGVRTQMGLSVAYQLDTFSYQMNAVSYQVNTVSYLLNTVSYRLARGCASF